MDRFQIPNIINAISQAWPVKDSALDILCDNLVARTFPRRHLIIEEGKAAGMAYFIEKGMTRSFWIVDGEEITTSFSIEGGIVFSMDEFYYGKISEENVETIEPCETYGISIETLHALFNTEIDLANWGRVIHQNEYRRIHQSHKERLTLPAKERYQAFHDQFPEICRRARLTDIASYLRVTLPTLSRIRAII